MARSEVTLNTKDIKGAKVRIVWSCLVSLVSFLPFVSLVSVGAAQELTVAAASDLQPALPRIAAQFEKETGRALRISYGSSGNFFTQIRNGAPFDVFLSADAEYPQRLADAGLAVRTSLTTYALGTLVLWTRRDSGVDVSLGWAAALDPQVQRIAIANPDHAPYGRAAVAAMKAA